MVQVESESSQAISSGLQAELLAIKHGVELAQQLRYQKVQVKSESSFSEKKKKKK